jgi:hypothetical protein
MNQLPFASLVVLCLCGATTVSAEGSCASKSCEWSELHTLKQLPPEVLSFLVNDPPKGIADRGEKFNVTDVVNTALPMKRFVLAAMASDRLVVEVERGGRSRYFQTFDFRLLDHQWVYASRTNTSEQIDDVSTLLRRLNGPKRD